MSNKFHNINFSQVSILVIVSYLVAISLTIITLNNPVLSFLPPFGLLVVLFWSLQLINSNHLVTAMLIGLVYDVLYITLLGSHALIFILVLFFMLRVRLRLRSYPLWQQGIFVGIYFFIYQLLHFLFFSPSFIETSPLFYWLMPVSAVFIWPALVVTLRALSNKFSTI